MQVAAGLEACRQLGHQRRLDQAALVVALLVPGVGKEDVHAIQAAGGQHVVEHLHGVVLQDAPGDKARKVFVLSRGTPLEIVLEQGEWLRVRDQTGLMAWIRKQDVSSLRTLQVIKPATVRREADAKSAAIFRAETGLLLDLLESTKTGWIKVKHRDGDIGFIRIEEVWGL